VSTTTSCLKGYIEIDPAIIKTPKIKIKNRLLKKKNLEEKDLLLEHSSVGCCSLVVVFIYSFKETKKGPTVQGRSCTKK